MKRKNTVEYSMMEIKIYIHQIDQTDKKQYIVNEYDCRRFAGNLVNNLHAHFPGIKAKISIVDGIKTLHAVVKITTSEGSFLIEPQTDRDVTSVYEMDKHPFYDLFSNIIYRL